MDKKSYQIESKDIVIVKEPVSFVKERRIDRDAVLNLISIKDKETEELTKRIADIAVERAVLVADLEEFNVPEVKDAIAALNVEPKEIVEK